MSDILSIFVSIFLAFILKGSSGYWGQVSLDTSPSILDIFGHCDLFFYMGEGSSAQILLPIIEDAHFWPDSMGMTLQKSIRDLTVTPRGSEGLSVFRPNCFTHFIQFSLSTIQALAQEGKRVLNKLPKSHTLIFMKPVLNELKLKMDNGTENTGIDQLPLNVTQTIIDLARSWNSRIYFLTIPWPRVKIQSLSFLCPYCPSSGIYQIPFSMEPPILEKFTFKHMANQHRSPVQLKSILHYFPAELPDCRDPMNLMYNLNMNPTIFCVITSLTTAQLLSDKFNFTLITGSAQVGQKRSGSFVYSPGRWSLDPGSPSTTLPYFLPIIEHKLMYCTRSKARKYMRPLRLLTDPADRWTWFATIISYWIGTTLILSLAKPSRSKYILWALIFCVSFLVRQSFIFRVGFIRWRIGNGIMVLMTFCAIVISSGYEGFLTSYVIVPPRPYILNGLTELLDSGYKILVQVPPISIGFNQSVEKYKRAFRRSGNLQRFSSSFFVSQQIVFDDLERDLVPSSKNRTKTRVAFPEETRLLKTAIQHMHGKYPNISCFVLRGHDPISFVLRMWVFINYFAPEFQAFVRGLDENGMNFFHEKILGWSDDIKGRDIQDVEQGHNGRLNASSMEGHIRSIFLVYAACTLGSIAIFLIERFFKWIQHRFSKNGQRAKGWRSQNF